MIKNYGVVVDNVREELKKHLLENPNLKVLVLGVSGGLDSALVAALAKPVCDELGVKLVGRSITIESNKPEEISRAKEIGEAFCHNFKELNLTKEYEALKSVDEDTIDDLYVPNELSEKIRRGNIKARVRMIQLYHLASKYNGLVMSTDNWTEFNLGFWTLHGDVGDYGIIQELWKGEIYHVAQWLCDNELADSFFKRNKKTRLALQACIDGVATDGLGITKSDLDQILPNWVGSSKDGYIEVDKILSTYINEWVGDVENPVIKRHIRSSFKRKNPLNIPRSILINGSEE